MKRNRKMIRGVSLVLLVITIAPLLMELEENIMGVGFITAGALGAAWASSRLYDEVRWYF